MQRELLVQGILVLILGAMLLTGLLINNIHRVPVSKSANAFDELDHRVMYVSGISVKSNSLTLDFNPCDEEVGDEYATTRLYDKEGVKFSELVPGVTRDKSIALFAYTNLRMTGSEIFGDIGILAQRGVLSRVLLWFGFTCQCINFLLILGRYFRGFGSYYWFPLLLIMGVLVSYGSLINSTSTIPILLAHVFHEAILRCKLVPPLRYDHHWELENLAKFYDKHAALPNGTTVIMLISVISLSIAYIVAYLCFFAIKTVRLIYLVRFRSLQWYTRIWSVYVTIPVFVLAALSVYYVALDDRLRGYRLNVYHWDYASKTKVGLSMTGTLLDVVQDLFLLVTIPRTILRASIYLWLSLLPVIAAASMYPFATLLKSVQDLSVLLLLRSLIAWVTVVPASISILDNAACYQVPKISGTLSSCNDSMFSIQTIALVLPTMTGLFFLKFTGILRPKLYWFANIIAAAAVLSLLGVLVLARYQYTSDVSIGLFVCVLYMITQQSAYELLFNKESNTRNTPQSILQDALVPALDECVRRVTEYNLATNQDMQTKITSDELDEVKKLYQNVGDAISRARSTRSIASSPVAIGTPINEKKEQ